MVYEKTPELNKAEAKVEKKAEEALTQMTLFEPKVTSEEDAAYMDAVKRGDMATAARAR